MSVIHMVMLCNSSYEGHNVCSVCFVQCMHAVSRRVPIILVPFTGHAETNHDNTNGDTMAMQDDGRIEDASDTMTIPERRHDDAKGTLATGTSSS